MKYNFEWHDSIKKINDNNPAYDTTVLKSYEHK